MKTTFAVTPEDVRKAKAQYMKEWRKKNPEKDKKYKETYWRKKAEKMLISQQMESEVN